MFVCYVLRIIADEKAGGDREDEDSEPTKDSDGSGYSDSKDGNTADDHQARQTAKADYMKDARELFLWQGR